MTSWLRGPAELREETERGEGRGGRDECMKKRGRKSKNWRKGAGKGIEGEETKLMVL